ncbi:MAG: 2-oxoacid:acceptor oxidoreductase subunit alpha [Candidatus Baldrarchaeia archaeon]
MKKGRVEFWNGNIACAEGAIAAGCRFFAGYPITPSSEILEHMAKRMPEVGGVFIQMEDELAAIAAVIGASWGGVKAMTATSGPGFSLMQEGIGYACMTETPCVIVDVQRAGPSTGQATKAAQGDVMQARWGTHGDHEIIALAPNSPQEMFDLTVRAFNLSEMYRVPVIVLADEIVAHMWEKVRIPDDIEIVNRRKPSRPDEQIFGHELDTGVPPMPAFGEGYNLLVTGSTHDGYGFRKTADPLVHRKLVTRLVNKIRKNAEKIVDFEIYGCDPEDAEVMVVSYGCTSRSADEAVRQALEEGIKAINFRLRTIWPFPEKALRELAERVKLIVVPEMNLGQLYFEVERVACGRCPVILVSRIGGGEMVRPQDILRELRRA